MKRITKFLCLPELEESKDLRISTFITKGEGIELNIENLSASYGSSATKNFSANNGKIKDKKVKFSNTNGELFNQNVLKNINLRCQPGELNVIVGPVGSGNF